MASGVGLGRVVDSTLSNPFKIADLLCRELPFTKIGHRGVCVRTVQPLSKIRRRGAMNRKKRSDWGEMLSPVQQGAQEAPTSRARVDV